MKTRRILCAAAALCMLLSVCCAAGADGAQNSGNYYGTVNIATAGVKPTYYEAQDYNGKVNTSGIPNLLDGRIDTGVLHYCWESVAKDEIPDISFYFNGATIQDIWLRNGYKYDGNTDCARLMLLDVTVWCGEISYKIPRFRLQDSMDASRLNADWYDGYQRLALTKKYENVTRIDLFIRGWYQGTGNGTKYAMMFSDLVFMPASLEDIYGPGIWNGGGYNPYPTWAPTLVPTWAPTLAPTATPAPVVTSTPGNGIDVITTDRLATRSGPGTDYTETHSYFTKGTWVKAISSAYDNRNGIWWIQVELTYAGELRRVYTGVKRLQMNADMVPVEQVQGAGRLTRSVIGYWGPGYGYSQYPDYIPAGTTGTIWAYEGYYAQFEFYDTSSKLYRRVWVPLNALEEDEGNG